MSNDEPEVIDYSIQFLKRFYYNVEYIDRSYDFLCDRKKIEMKKANLFTWRKTTNTYKIGEFAFYDKDGNGDIDSFLFVIRVNPFYNEFSNYIFKLTDKVREIQKIINKRKSKIKNITILQITKAINGEKK